MFGALLVPNATVPCASRTPPVGSASPCNVIRSCPPLLLDSVKLRCNVTNPEESGPCWLSVPATFAVNGGEGNAATAVLRLGVDVDATAVRCGARLAGVPARLAHPLASGPAAANPTTAIGSTMLATAAGRRTAARDGQPAPM